MGQYIEGLRGARERITIDNQTFAASIDLRLTGHIFDSGLLTQILDIVELNAGRCVLKSVVPGHSRTTSSVAEMQLMFNSEAEVESCVKSVNAVVEALIVANAQLQVLGPGGSVESVKMRNDRI